MMDLVMQRQPTSCTDVNTVGNFLNGDEALHEVRADKRLLVDISHLLSSVVDEKKAETKKRTEQDTRVAKELGLGFWHSKTVRGFMCCYHYDKRRCI